MRPSRTDRTGNAGSPAVAEARPAAGGGGAAAVGLRSRAFEVGPAGVKPGGGAAGGNAGLAEAIAGDAPAIGGPAVADALARNVFLSPRVVDREAFGDFAQTLRQIIQQASEHAESLRVASTEAKGLADQVQAVAGKHGPRVEAAAKVLATLDSRVQTAERIIETAREAAARLAEFEAASAAASLTAEEAFRAKVDGVVADAERRLEEMAARITGRAADLEGRAVRTIETAAAKATDARTGLVGAMEAAESRARATLTQLDRTVADAKERVEAIPEAVNTRATAAQAAAERALAEIEERIAGAPDRLEGMIAAPLERLRAEATRAEDLLRTVAAPLAGTGSDTATGGNDAGVESGLTLAQLIVRGEALADGAQAAVRQFDSVRQQAELARRLLGQSLLESTTAIDRLADCAAALTQQAQEAVERMGTARGA